MNNNINELALDDLDKVTGGVLSPFQEVNVAKRNEVSGGATDPNAAQNNNNGTQNSQTSRPAILRA